MVVRWATGDGGGRRTRVLRREGGCSHPCCASEHSRWLAILLKPTPRAQQAGIDLVGDDEDGAPHPVDQPGAQGGARKEPVRRKATATWSSSRLHRLLEGFGAKESRHFNLVNDVFCSITELQSCYSVFSVANGTERTRALAPRTPASGFRPVVGAAQPPVRLDDISAIVCIDGTTGRRRSAKTEARICRLVGSLMAGRSLMILWRCCACNDRCQGLASPASSWQAPKCWRRAGRLYYPGPAALPQAARVSKTHNTSFTGAPLIPAAPATQTSVPRGLA